ncbi:type IV pilus modification PilV family protein [Microbacterium sp. A82]|uniref:type IV pilus modification PilV family protein n=1 Tax=unclassified Microbacterium TaxID=2609290 RepID=UPI003F378D4A
MRPRTSQREEGFTLIEVIIAISLLMTVAVAVGAFTIRGLHLSTQQQRTQAAVSVATERMDQVVRMTTSSAQLSSLVAGRSEASVAAAWNAASGVPGIAETYPAWSATASPTTAIEIEQTITRSGSDYDSVVLIGTCYQLPTGGLCTPLPGADQDPGPTSPLAADMSQLIRAVVVVTYAGKCDGGDTCRYTTTGLFDTKGDLTWRTD